MQGRVKGRRCNKASGFSNGSAQSVLVSANSTPSTTEFNRRSQEKDTTSEVGSRALTKPILTAKCRSSSSSVWMSFSPHESAAAEITAMQVRGACTCQASSFALPDKAI